MMRPMPVTEDTGVLMPENIDAGSSVKMAVPNKAAIWVRVKADTIMP